MHSLLHLVAPRSPVTFPDFSAQVVLTIQLDALIQQFQVGLAALDLGLAEGSHIQRSQLPGLGHGCRFQLLGRDHLVEEAGNDGFFRAEHFGVDHRTAEGSWRQAGTGQFERVRANPG